MRFHSTSTFFTYRPRVKELGHAHRCCRTIHLPPYIYQKYLDIHLEYLIFKYSNNA